MVKGKLQIELGLVSRLYLSKWKKSFFLDDATLDGVGVCNDLRNIKMNNEDEFLYENL